MPLRLVPCEAQENATLELAKDPRPIPFPSQAVEIMREASRRARHERAGTNDAIAHAERALQAVELNFEKLIRQMHEPVTPKDDGPDRGAPRAA
jgi:hypothetical protein